MKNLHRLWVILLVVSGGIAVWFSGVALVSLWKYSLLNAQAPAQILNWQVCDLSSSRYAVSADYQFTINGVVYDGKTVFENPHYLNRFAAEHSIRHHSNHSWKAWYRESNPLRSSLEREFPMKKCLHALLTLGVFGYFFFARGMVSRFFSF